MKAIFTFALLFLCSFVFSQSQGPNNASIANTQTIGTLANGYTDWTNIPGAITAVDGSYASVTLFRSGSTNRPFSNYLRLSGYSFTIPTGYTITGIAVSITQRYSGDNAGLTGTATLLKNNTAVGTPITFSPTYTGNVVNGGSFTTINVGGSTELWGTTWTESDINNINFGTLVELHRTGNGNGQTFTANIDAVTITVYYRSPAPIATSNSYTAGGDLTPITGNLITDGTPDSDPDGGTVTAQLATAPSSGTVLINTDGSFTYTPPATNFPGGIITFTYTATDDDSPSSTSTPATVTLTYPQPAPTAANDQFEAATSDATVTGNVILGTSNGGLDTDPQNQQLTAMLVSNPSVTGTFNFNADGSFSYTPPTGFAGGSVTFTYQVTDNGNPAATSSTATVTLDYPIGIPPPGSTLPVNFLSFDAQSSSNGTILTWKVGVEENVKGYAVERSTDGKQYTSIGFVPATRLSSYSFTDKQPLSNLTFYRVKNVDHDGKFKYSTILKLNNGKSETVSKVVPSVTRTGQLTFQHSVIENNSRISISTFDGRAIRIIQPIKGSITTPIDLGAYPTGTYVLLFTNGSGKTESFKIIKQ